MDTMNFNLRNTLYGVIILALLVGSYAAFVYAKAYAGSVGPTAYRSFGVTGEGKVVAVPDVATFSFSVINQGGADIGKLQSDNTKKVNSAIEFLKKTGVDEKDITTSGYNVSPRYQGFNCNAVTGICPPSQIIGYEISQTVNVKVRSFDKIGAILSGVVAAGANSVSSLQFTVDDIKKLENEARGLAIKQAEEMAKEVADAADFRLGSLLSVDEFYPQPYPYGGGGDMMEAKAISLQAQNPTIAPGSQEIIIRVNARYQIK